MTGTPSPRQQRQDDFRAAMGGDVLFVRDALDAVEAIISDELATPGQRSLALWKRWSWGNFSLYAVKEDGSNFTQADTGRALKLNKGTISRVVSYYVSRGYIRLEGQRIFPVIHPVLTEPSDRVAQSTTFDRFLEEWKVANCATFEAWEEAKQKAKVAQQEASVRGKVVLCAFQRWRRAQPNAPPYKNLRTTEEPEERSESSSSGIALVPSATTTATVPEPTPPAPPASPPEVSPLEAGITRVWIEAGKDNPSPQQLASAVAALPKDPEAVGPFLEILRAKVRKLQHPGSLQRVAEGFTVRWNNRAPPEPKRSGNGVCAECEGRGIVRGPYAQERCRCQRIPAGSERNETEQQREKGG